MGRTVSIHNVCPRLCLDRRAVVAVIHLLDAHAARIIGGRASPFSPRPSRLGRRPSTFDVRPSTLPAVPPGELSLAFLPAAALARLHASFLGDASPTDVIAFPAPPASGGPAAGSAVAGEICVSPDAARAFAGKHGRDFSAELTLYLAHGWLHLAGHDDLEPAAKRRMRAAERRAMALLRAARAMPRFTWA